MTNLAIYFSVVIMAALGLKLIQRCGMTKEWNKEEYLWFWIIVLFWPITSFFIALAFICFLFVLPFLAFVWLMAVIPASIINLFRND